MACGHGLSAVRALLREAAASSSKSACSDGVPAATPKLCGAVTPSAPSAGEVVTLTTIASIDDLYLDELSDEEDDSSDDEDCSAADPSSSSARAVTTSAILDPSQFLKPKQYAAYKQLHPSHTSIDDLYLDGFLSEEDDDSSDDEACSAADASSRSARAVTTAAIPDPSQFLKPKQYAAFKQLHSSHKGDVCRTLSA